MEKKQFMRLFENDPSVRARGIWEAQQIAKRCMTAANAFDFCNAVTLSVNACCSGFIYNFLFQYFARKNIHTMVPFIKKYRGEKLHGRHDQCSFSNFKLKDLPFLTASEIFQAETGCFVIALPYRYITLANTAGTPRQVRAGS